MQFISKNEQVVLPKMFITALHPNLRGGRPKEDKDEADAREKKP